MLLQVGGLQRQRDLGADEDVIAGGYLPKEIKPLLKRNGLYRDQRAQSPMSISTD